MTAALEPQPAEEPQLAEEPQPAEPAPTENDENDDEVWPLLYSSSVDMFDRPLVLTRESASAWRESTQIHRL